MLASPSFLPTQESLSPVAAEVTRLHSPLECGASSPCSTADLSRCLGRDAFLLCHHLGCIPPESVSYYPGSGMDDTRIGQGASVPARREPLPANPTARWGQTRPTREGWDKGSSGSPSQGLASNYESSRAGVKNVECGDLSPLSPLWRLVAKAGPRIAERLGTTTGRSLAFNGDKSPARKRRELAALQSRWLRRQPRQVHLLESVVKTRDGTPFTPIRAIRVKFHPSGCPSALVGTHSTASPST